MNEKERTIVSRNRGSKIQLDFRGAPEKHRGRRQVLRAAWPQQEQRAVSRIQASHDCTVSCRICRGHLFYHGQRKASSHDCRRDNNCSHPYLMQASKFKVTVFPFARSPSATNTSRNPAVGNFAAQLGALVATICSSPGWRCFRMIGPSIAPSWRCALFATICAKRQHTGHRPQSPVSKSAALQRAFFSKIAGSSRAPHYSLAREAFRNKIVTTQVFQTFIARPTEVCIEWRERPLRGQTAEC